MNPLKLNEAKELNKLLGGELSEAYKEIARLRAKNAQRDKLKAAVISDLQKNLESAKEESKKFQRKIAVLQRKLSDKKREKTELRIELNRTKIRSKTKDRIRSKIRRTSKILSTSTVSNSEWSTEESLKNSISNQASIKPQTVFKVSIRVIFFKNDNLLSREFMPIHSDQLIWVLSLVRLDW